MATQAPITHFTRTRVAIVTGGAQGIGKAIALRLAADGFDICVDDVASKTHLLKEVVAEIQQLGRKAIALPYDVTKEQEVKEMVEKTVMDLGGLDVVTYLWTTPVCLFLMILPPQDGCECWNRTRLERPHGRYFRTCILPTHFLQRPTSSKYRRMGIYLGSQHARHGALL